MFIKEQHNDKDIINDFKKSITDLLKNDSKKSGQLINSLTDIFAELIKIINFQEPLCEVIELESITYPVPSDIKQLVYKNQQHLDNDFEINALTNIISFRFFTLLSVYNNELWNRITADKTNDISSWYHDWELRILKFDKNRLSKPKEKELVI